VSPADIQRVAVPVLRHRVLPTFAAEAEGVTVDRIVAEVLERVRPPASDIRV
jgi:MoxR-like ATPase